MHLDYNLRKTGWRLKQSNKISDKEIIGRRVIKQTNQLDFRKKIEIFKSCKSCIHKLILETWTCSTYSCKNKKSLTSFKVKYSELHETSNILIKMSRK